MLEVGLAIQKGVMMLDQLEFLDDAEWKYILVLDACRYDYFEKNFSDYLNGDLYESESPVSCEDGVATSEWAKSVFTDYYDEIVYVSSTPHVNSRMEINGFRGIDHFHEVYDVWDWGWDDEMGTVLPSKVNESVLEADENFPDKKIIGHYMQPHLPYLSLGNFGSFDVMKTRARDEKESTENLKEALDKVLVIFEEKFEKPVEFKKPEVLVIINLKEEKVEIDINSLYIYGEYNKIVRDIPQTKWPSGKYKTSVEEIMAKPLMKQVGGTGHKFHGMGREDIDAKCLGWRPFVLEILEPEKRDVNKKKFRKDVNKTKKVKIKNLELVDSDVVEKIKSQRPDKTYKTVVKLEDEVKKGDLEKLSLLEGKKIYQETPNRVLHRRSDRLRKRIVKEIKWKKLGKKKIELEITAEAGTYIKELVSGDKGRTYPSVSEILRTDAEVEELDVTKVHK